MKTYVAPSSRLKCLAVFGFGFSLFAMIAVAAVLYHSVAFGDLLNHVAKHTVTENARLAACLGFGLAVELLVIACLVPFFRHRKAQP